MANYAWADAHGCYHFYEVIKAKLNPEDKVFFLGDAGDRGPESWKTIKAIYNDPQFIYLKGNHEDMLVQALRGYFSKGSYSRYYHGLVQNGGTKTFEDAIADSEAREWVERLSHLPLCQIYHNTNGKNVFLTHAGFTPYWDSEDGCMEDPTYSDLLWNRDHWLEPWDDCFDNVVIVHGHTPQPFIAQDLPEWRDVEEIPPGALWYENNHKCCIDTGAVWTNYTVLLNLDTWEEEIFAI